MSSPLGLVVAVAACAGVHGLHYDLDVVAALEAVDMSAEETNEDSKSGFTIPPNFVPPVPPGLTTTRPPAQTVPSGTTHAPPAGSFNVPTPVGYATPRPTDENLPDGPNTDGCPASCDDNWQPSDLCVDYDVEATSMIDRMKTYGAVSDPSLTNCSSTPAIVPYCTDATLGLAFQQVCGATCSRLASTPCPNTPCDDNDAAARVIMEHSILVNERYAYDGCQDTNGTLILGHSRTERHCESPGIRLACPSFCDCFLQATATDDPHITNLAGEHFDINMPADHVLLRVPADEAQPALLEVRGLVRADARDACAMYIKLVTLRGEWLGNATVQVRPLQRDEPGSNSAGSCIVSPFSLRKLAPSAAGDWKSPADFAAAEPLSEAAGVVARLTTPESAGHPEGQRFEFAVGKGALASIRVSQALHQALNVEVSNLRALRQPRLGGLLGTEPHRRNVERQTDECKASRVSPVEFEMARMRAPTDTLGLAVSW